MTELDLWEPQDRRGELTHLGCPECLSFPCVQLGRDLIFPRDPDDLKTAVIS